MNLVSLGTPLLALELTLNSGQAFHWKREGHGWLGAIGEAAVYLEQRNGELFVNAGAESAASNYLALDHPLEEIAASFPKDPVTQEALSFCHGMRILRQPRWEALATFITSSMKQVAHIAQISHTLRQRFGRPLDWEGRSMHTYPSPEALGALSEADLRACALGYRAANLLASAQRIASGDTDLDRIAELPDAEAQMALRNLPGVGEKVANCALLFGFERLKAFPVDVWIERVIRVRYFRKRQKVTPATIRAFCSKSFGPYGGYAQQYLFHHARLTWKKG
ncbi:MAG: N-glycosylase/DNA lyase [Verrucomicrobia bacterium]|nr:MAG: N-glycosylase/DNA lyase [Verrucomicrobiota bacterium]